MIAPKQDQAVWQDIFRSMAELIKRPSGDNSDQHQVREIAIPSDLSETYYDANLWQGANLRG